MNQYQYDQIYPREKLLHKVKDFIMPTELETINPNELMSIELSSYEYSDIVYIHAMAMSYNNGDL